MTLWLRVLHNRALLVVIFLLLAPVMAPFLMLVSLTDPHAASRAFGLCESLFRDLWRDASLTKEEAEAKYADTRD